jgi:hypothetical protein
MTCLPEFQIEAFVKAVFAAYKQTEENPLPTARANGIASVKHLNHRSRDGAVLSKRPVIYFSAGLLSFTSTVMRIHG